MDSLLLRSAALRVAFVFALILVAMGLAGSPARADDESVRVMGALFTPTRADDRLDERAERARSEIVWSARWVLSIEDADAVAKGRARVLRFATPLPEGETIDAAPGLAPISANGQLVGVRVGPEAIDGRTVRATLRQPLPHGATTKLALGAPVASGTSAQIVDGDLGGGSRLEPSEGASTSKGLEHHVGYTGPIEIGHAARDEARRLTGYGRRVTGAPLYVRGEDVRARGQIFVDVVSGSERRSHGNLAVGAGFVVLVGALVLAMKRLRDRASVERADAMLAQEIEGTR